MRHIKFIFAFVSLTLTQLSFACECNSQGDFLKVVKKTPFVALVKVTKYLTFKDIYQEKMPMSMEVEIIRVYKGKETRKKVIVWGDNGILCRPYLSKFKTGQSYVIAFNSASETSRGLASESEKATDYSISICGEYWLDIDMHNKTVVSPTTEYQTHFTLKELPHELILSEKNDTNKKRASK